MAIKQEKIIGPSKLTRFERARIISARALQISMGAPPLIMTTKTSPLEVAEEELKAGVLPITIRRRLPDGHYQDIPLKWLIEKESKK